MLTEIGIASITFAITNIDDLLILSLYFANPTYRTWNILLGQYLGIIAIILVGLTGLILDTFFADHWISFLGVIPMTIGFRGLYQLRLTDESEEEELPAPKSRFQILSVALVTIANGGDNIGVYVPLFANLTSSQIYLYVFVFLVLTTVWCMIALFITSHPRVKSIFAKHGKVVLSTFLILLGFFIMKEFLIWLINLTIAS